MYYNLLYQKKSRPTDGSMISLQNEIISEDTGLMALLGLGWETNACVKWFHRVCDHMYWIGLGSIASS